MRAFAALRESDQLSGDCARVQAIARAHFGLDADETVLVSEHAGTLPGCPPLETVIAFWTELPDGSTQRHHCKVFKPVHQVCAADLPPPWMKPALVVAPDYACDCC